MEFYKAPSASREFGTHINFSLCLCIFIIMDFIAVNNSSDKYKMSCRGKQDSRSTRNDAVDVLVLSGAPLLLLLLRLLLLLQP